MGTPFFYYDAVLLLQLVYVSFMISSCLCEIIDLTNYIDHTRVFEGMVSMPVRLAGKRATMTVSFKKTIIIFQFLKQIDVSFVYTYRTF